MKISWNQFKKELDAYAEKLFNGIIPTPPSIVEANLYTKYKLLAGESLPEGFLPDVLFLDSGTLQSAEPFTHVLPVPAGYFYKNSEYSAAEGTTAVTFSFANNELTITADTANDLHVVAKFELSRVTETIPAPTVLPGSFVDSVEYITVAFSQLMREDSELVDVANYTLLKNGVPAAITEVVTGINTSILSIVTADPIAHGDVLVLSISNTIKNIYGVSFAGATEIEILNLIPAPIEGPLIVSADDSLVTDESFTITAEVDPGGLSTVVTLEYGRGLLYENVIAFPDSPIEASETISVSLTGLPTDKDCNWRVKAVNSEGTTYLTGTTKTATWRTTSSVGDPDYYVEGQTFYIDPTVVSSGNGSIESPWKAWSNIVWANDRIFLIKRGTTLEAANFGRLNTQSNITIAGYGVGDRPILHGTTTSSSSKILDMGGAGNLNIKISGLEIRQAGTPVSTLVNIAQDNVNFVIEYCFIHNGTFGVRLRANNGLYFTDATIKNCVIEQITDDGIYAYSINGLNIINTKVHEVNINWVPPTTSQTIAAGDCVQLILVNDYLIRDCVLDRSNSGNKFAFIQNAPGNGIIEFSELVSPINTSEGGAVQYSQAGHVQITRDSIIRGNSNDPATSLTGIYHNNSSGSYTSERNKYINLPMGISNLAGLCTSKDDVFINCSDDFVGAVTIL